MARSARGGGSIRKKTVTRSGTTYTFWEARVTTGRDPATGKQVQRSISGKTQAEVRRKMQEVSHAVDTNTYIAPTKTTLGQWLDIWARDFTSSIKPTSKTVYLYAVNNRIKPALGAIQLSELQPHMIQRFVNDMEDLAPSTIQLVTRVLNIALGKAVALGYIARNPVNSVELPKKQASNIHPLDDDQVSALIAAARGSDLENLITVALFTGARQSELLALTWDSIDFKTGTIDICKQLARPTFRKDGLFTSPKNGKSRIIAPAPSVMETLRQQQRRQLEQRISAGALWDNPHFLVFTSPTGDPLNQDLVRWQFSRLLSAAKLSGFRFHDLRHTYAVNSIRAGIDVKTIQISLGHASAAFTLDRYGHVTDRMRQDSAARMETFMTSVLNL